MFSDVITLPLNRGDITVMSFRDCKSPIDEREGEKERRGGERERGRRRKQAFINNSPLQSIKDWTGVFDPPPRQFPRR